MQIISLTSCNFSNIIVRFYLAYQKCFFHLNQHCSLLYLLLENNTFCVLFYSHYVQMVKQKVNLLFENLDQLSNLNMGFMSVLLLLIDICFSSLFFYNLISFAVMGLYCVKLIKLQLLHRVLYQLLQMLRFHLQQQQM